MNKLIFCAVVAAAASDALAVDSGPAFVIGGFDSSRGGDYSIAAGAAWSDARASLAVHFPGASFKAFPEVTTQALTGVDIVVLGSPATNGSAIAPLSSSEQDALLAFIRGGGSAMLLADNDEFDINAPAVNKSLLDPFGAAVVGTSCVPNAFVQAPSASAVTAGPFGTISSFMQGCEGGLTSVGPYATSLATNPIGSALAVIAAGTLAPASGRVLIFSDINSFQSASYPGGSFVNFSQNEALFLNSIEFTRPLVLGGFDSTRADDYSLATGAAWSDARASLAAHFPHASFDSFPELSTESLAGVDILVLSSVATNGSAIAPLSSSEQDALLAFIRRGGRAILLADNDEFDINAADVNASLLNPFGAAVAGTSCVPDVSVQVPTASPVTAGPFGTINWFRQGCEGGLTAVGPYATSLATNAIGIALAVIDAGALAPSSGRVVMFSDTNEFQSASYPGGSFVNFSQNEALFLNSVAACR